MKRLKTASNPNKGKMIVTVKTTFEKLADKIDTTKVYELPKIGTWPHSFHVFDKESLLAIDAARAAKRPLLIKGEPGTGKSQLARAAAHILKSRFISKVIDSQTELEDLYFRYDAVRRLGEAQLLSVMHGKCSLDELNKKLNLEQFIVPGPMWWAFDWQDAAKHCEEAKLAEHGYPVYASEDANTSEGKSSVLLLDEIDKADADLANGLLEALGNGSFRVDPLGKTVGADNNTSSCALVVITSNNERHLPPAFLRRCAVLKLSLPKNEKGFVELLCRRGKQHHQDSKGKSTISHRVLEKAAGQLWQDRMKAENLRVSLPGQAEFLDVLNVLVENAKTEDEQISLLEKVSGFFFQKHDDLRKDREEG